MQNKSKITIGDNSPIINDEQRARIEYSLFADISLFSQEEEQNICRSMLRHPHEAYAVFLTVYHELKEAYDREELREEEYREIRDAGERLIYESADYPSQTLARVFMLYRLDGFDCSDEFTAFYETLRVWKDLEDKAERMKPMPIHRVHIFD